MQATDFETIMDHDAMDTAQVPIEVSGQNSLPQKIVRQEAPIATATAAKPTFSSLVVQQYLKDINFIILFSFAGYLTRYGLDVAFMAPTGVANTSLFFVLFKDIYANALGCFLMGIFAEINTAILTPNKYTRFSNLITVGVMTGYCGSTTTFSAWQFDCMYALITGQVGTFFFREIIGMCVSYYALVAGHDISQLVFVPLYNKAKSVKVTGKPHDFIEEVRESGTDGIWRWIIIAFVIANLLAIATFITLLSISSLGESWHIVFAAALMAPFGATLRYVCSLLNTKYAPKIPLFTFFANLVGTIIVGFFRITDQRYSAINTKEGLNVFFLGVTNGFCGCLTTVSSFVEEVHTKLKDVRWKYLYILMTFVFPCLALLVIVGPFVWTQ
jgi:fluoride ion exporter CrcB/FEX